MVPSSLLSVLSLSSTGHISTPFTLVMYLSGSTSHVSHYPWCMQRPRVPISKLMFNSFATVSTRFFPALGLVPQGRRWRQNRSADFRFLAVICSNCIVCSRSLPFPSCSKLSSESPCFISSLEFFASLSSSRVLSPDTLLTEAMSVCICFRMEWCVIEQHTCKKG